jgi:predicted dehydrogenase
VIFTNNYLDLINNNDIDIVIVATPTNTHHIILCAFQNNINIKIFFMEKPLFNSLEDYENIPTPLKDKIVVNYLRRFNKNIQKLKKNIQNDNFHNLEKIIINYCKGLKNNGSHMIDLINFLFDNPKIISSQILDQTIGFNKEDLTYDVFLRIEYQNKIIPIYFIGLNHEQYNIIEMHLYFENQIVKFINSKNQIEYYDIVPHELYPTYKIISNTPKTENLKNENILEAYNNLFGIIKKNEKNISSFNDEITNIKFLSSIFEKAKNEKTSN